MDSRGKCMLYAAIFKWPVKVLMHWPCNMCKEDLYLQCPACGTALCEQHMLTKCTDHCVYFKQLPKYVQYACNKMTYPKKTVNSSVYPGKLLPCLIFCLNVLCIKVFNFHGILQVKANVHLRNADLTFIYLVHHVYNFAASTTKTRLVKNMQFFKVGIFFKHIDHHYYYKNIFLL